MKSRNELKEFRSQNPKQLYKELEKNYQKLRELNFADKFRKNKDINIIKKTRQTIARIWTVLGEAVSKQTALASKKESK